MSVTEIFVLESANLSACVHSFLKRASSCTNMSLLRENGITLQVKHNNIVWLCRIFSMKGKELFKAMLCSKAECELSLGRAICIIYCKVLAGCSSSWLHRHQKSPFWRTEKKRLAWICTNPGVVGRSNYTGTRSMQLKRNEQIKSMRITYSVVSKDQTKEKNKAIAWSTEKYSSWSS